MSDSFKYLYNGYDYTFSYDIDEDILYISCINKTTFNSYEYIAHSHISSKENAGKSTELSFANIYKILKNILDDNDDIYTEHYNIDINYGESITINKKSPIDELAEIYILNLCLIKQSEISILDKKIDKLIRNQNKLKQLQKMDKEKLISEFKKNDDKLKLINRDINAIHDYTIYIIMLIILQLIFHMILVAIAK